MNTPLTYLLLTAVLLAPFALVAALASRSHHNTWMSRRLFDDAGNADADIRRMGHDLDAVRTRFEQHPSWPASGSRSERR